MRARSRATSATSTRTAPRRPTTTRSRRSRCTASSTAARRRCRRRSPRSGTCSGRPARWRRWRRWARSSAACCRRRSTTRSPTRSATSTTCPTVRAKRPGWSWHFPTRSASEARTHAWRSRAHDAPDDTRGPRTGKPGWLAGAKRVSAAVATPVDYGLPLARIDLLCDPGTFSPLRSAVGDGVVAGQGRVSGRSVFAWAQDGADRGGSLGAAGGETIARTIELADRAGAPVVGFLHSGGARLQEGTASLQAYAAIFRAQATARVPQVSVVAGPCAGGAAYSPALGDIVVMAGSRARLFLTGPQVVEAVTRGRGSADELGGARGARPPRARHPVPRGGGAPPGGGGGGGGHARTRERRRARRAARARPHGRRAPDRRGRRPRRGGRARRPGPPALAPRRAAATGTAGGAGRRRPLRPAAQAGPRG